LQRLIDWLNTHHSLNIAKLPLNTSPLDNNAWFPGFTEVDGFFGIITSEAKPKSETRKRSQSRRVKCRFTIGQRQFDKPTGLSCEAFMSMITKYFEVSLLTSIRNNAQFSSPAQCYYFSVESPQELSKQSYHLLRKVSINRH
jgi:hypothetical protein